MARVLLIFVAIVGLTAAQTKFDTMGRPLFDAMTAAPVISPLPQIPPTEQRLLLPIPPQLPINEPRQSAPVAPPQSSLGPQQQPPPLPAIPNGRFDVFNKDRIRIQGFQPLDPRSVKVRRGLFAEDEFFAFEAREDGEEFLLVTGEPVLDSFDRDAETDSFEGSGSELDNSLATVEPEPDLASLTLRPESGYDESATQITTRIPEFPFSNNEESNFILEDEEFEQSSIPQEEEGSGFNPEIEEASVVVDSQSENPTADGQSEENKVDEDIRVEQVDGDSNTEEPVDEDIRVEQVDGENHAEEPVDEDSNSEDDEKRRMKNKVNTISWFNLLFNIPQAPMQVENDESSQIVDSSAPEFKTGPFGSGTRASEELPTISPSSVNPNSIPLFGNSKFVNILKKHASLIVGVILGVPATVVLCYFIYLKRLKRYTGTLDVSPRSSAALLHKKRPELTPSPKSVCSEENELACSPSASGSRKSSGSQKRTPLPPPLPNHAKIIP